MAINKNIFTVNWDKLSTWLMPDDLIMPGIMAWAKALVTPVVDLYGQFMIFKDYTTYWLNITPQVCFMEKALNDKYDFSQRRIFIKDGDEKLPVVFYLKDENKPLVIYKKGEGPPLVLYTKSETAQFTSDFVVVVPGSLVFNTNEMIAFINSIPNLASKTFKIITA